MHKIVFCITGLSGTGKSSICRALNTLKSKRKIIQYTSRPPRDGEEDGVDYHFLTQDDMALKAATGIITCFETYEVANGDTWLYGYNKNDIYSGAVLALNPSSINQLKEDGYKVITINIVIPEYLRLYRMLKRKDNQGLKEIIRRSKADKKLFKGYKFDYQVENREFLVTVKEIDNIIFENSLQKII